MEALDALAAAVCGLRGSRKPLTQDRKKSCTRKGKEIPLSSGSGDSQLCVSAVPTLICPTRSAPIYIQCMHRLARLPAVIRRLVCSMRSNYHSLDTLAFNPQ